MAIDVEKLKARLAKMNAPRGGGGNKPEDLWLPDDGKHEARIVPWPEAIAAGLETAPFVEKWFYYDLGKRLVAPPLGQADPVRELRDGLFQDRTPENLAMAKTLRPKMRAYVPVLVRGEEDKGVRLWGMGQQVYKQLIEYIIDPDYGDITDIEQGTDIKVSIGESGKKWPDGRPIKDTTISMKRSPSPLADPADVPGILDSVPNIEEKYPSATYEALEQALESFLDGGASGRTETRGGGGSAPASSGGGASTNSLDDEFDALLNV